MPADYVIVNNDLLRITFFPPLLVPAVMAPVPLVASSSNVKVGGMYICLEGDELPPSLQPPQTYMSPPYVIPGTGTIKLTLNDTNKTAKVKNDGTIILIKGTPFTAEFEVASPAQQPTPGGPVPDPVSKKSGIAEFITTNVRVKAG
jgi:hypothetical protein